MTDAETWKEIAKQLAHALYDCLDVGLRNAATDDGEKVVAEIKVDAWRALKDYEKAGGV